MQFYDTFMVRTAVSSVSKFYVEDSPFFVAAMHSGLFAAHLLKESQTESEGGWMMELRGEEETFGDDKS